MNGMPTVCDSCPMLSCYRLQVAVAERAARLVLPNLQSSTFKMISPSQLSMLIDASE